MPNITVTISGVLKLLSQLDMKKSVGPDIISLHVLKEGSN